MKNIIIYLTTASLLYAQGPLTPPGAPAAAMKTLTQVEPRTPISSLPFTITNSGSYYFTGNLEFSASTGNAITINASNVTIDLMGFTLSSTSAVTGKAIAGGVEMSNITICNGHIKGNTTVSAYGTPTVWAVTPLGFSEGVSLGYVYGMSIIKDISVEGARTYGINATNALVENVTATQNGTVGISTTSSVSHCNAVLNGTWGIFAVSVSNSSARYNGTNGIWASSVANCYASYNGNIGIYATSGNGAISNSVANNNSSIGIQATNGSITNCTMSGNTTNDLVAANAVIAFCRFDTSSISTSTRTGNYPSP